MAKKFMYVCFGVLALMIAFHLGAQYGSAGYVDHSTTGIIAASSNDVLLDNGEMWRFQGHAWNLISWGLPVPVS